MKLEILTTILLFTQKTNCQETNSPKTSSPEQKPQTPSKTTEEQQYRFLMLQVAKSAQNFKTLVSKSKSVIDQYVENVNSETLGPSDQEITKFNSLWRENLSSIRAIRKDTRKLSNARVKVELATSLSNQLNMAVKLHQRFSLSRLAFNRAGILRTWVRTLEANNLEKGFDYEFAPRRRRTDTTLDKQAQLEQKIKYTNDALRVFRKLQIPETYITKARKTYPPESTKTSVPNAFLNLNGQIQSAAVRGNTQLDILYSELETTKRLIMNDRKNKNVINELIELVTQAGVEGSSEMFTEIERTVVAVSDGGSTFEKLVKEVIGAEGDGVSFSASGVFIMSVVCVMLITALAGILIYMRQKGKQLDRLDPNYYDDMISN